jgi:threonine dehydrogenase-like Zn-dependent dehydrogenase
VKGSMKILQIIAPGQVEWKDVPIPDPGPGEVLVKVESVTTCPHWDLHIMSGEPMFPGATLDYPYTPGQPGHEAMGEVVALGPDVTALTVGARVAAWRDAGHQRQGCYAQYVTAVVDNLLEIPADLSAAKVTSLELAMCLQVSFDQLARLDVLPGSRFGVSGLGPAGLIAVQMARACGAREVVAFDPLPARREFAANLGADIVLPPDDSFPPGRGNAALDAAIDCTGLKPSIEYLMARTRRAVAIFGVLRESVEFKAENWSGGFTLMGYEPHNRSAAERALQLIADGAIDLAPLTTHTLPFTRYAEGVDLLRTKEAIKIRFLPWEE